MKLYLAVTWCEQSADSKEEEFLRTLPTQQTKKILMRQEILMSNWAPPNPHYLLLEHLKRSGLEFWCMMIQYWITGSSLEGFLPVSKASSSAYWANIVGGLWGRLCLISISKAAPLSIIQDCFLQSVCRSMCWKYENDFTLPGREKESTAQEAWF